MTKLKWNSAGERLFEAGVDRGVLYTKDVGAPPAPVAVGAPSATKPMLLPLRQWGVDQALWLPGTAGNYGSIPDTNILPSNDAHLHQSKGGWFGNANAPTPVLSTDATPEIGSSHGKWTSTGDGNSSVSSQNNSATAGTTYSISARVRCGTGVARDIRIGFVWRTDASVFIGTTLGSVVSVDDSEWVTVTATAVAPANTGNVRPIIDVVSQLTGEVFYFDKVCLRTGSDPTFVPSTRIVGDLDMRWHGAFSEGVGAMLWKRNAASASYTLRRFNATIFRLGYNPDGAGYSEIALTPSSFFEGQEKHWRVTLDVDDGAGQHTHTLYTSDDGESWDEEDEDVRAGVVGSLDVSSGPLAFGEQVFAGNLSLKAAVLSFEIRDGIDGPIVASADFTNPAEVDGNSWTTPEGHTGTINRSGDATAELVDRNCWVMDTESLSITTRDSLDFDYGDFTVAGSGLTRTSGSNRAVIFKRSTSTSGNGWSLRHNFSRTAQWYMQTPESGEVRVDDYAFPGGQFITWRAGREAGISIVEPGDGGSTTGAVPGDVSNGEDISFAAFRGLNSWCAILSRWLAESEWLELESWDGSVANEPKWLRDDPDLVLYLNADADETVEAYEDDVVVSLHGLKPWYPDFHGIPWNGLVAVNERTVGGEVTPYYIDGIKYLDEASNEDFQATIEAYTYPEEFMQYEGYKEVHNGLFVTHQQKRSFGLSYRTLVGNDLEGTDHAYKIHIIYNAMVAPSDRDNNTISDDIDPQNFSWDVVTKPPDFTGYKQTAHFIIDSREIPTQLLKDLEDILYGTETTDPRLPLVTELIELFETGSVEELYDIWDAGELGETVDATIDGGEL